MVNTGRMTAGMAPRDAPDTLRPAPAHADARPWCGHPMRDGQARSGIARSRSRAIANSAAHGQPAGRWSLTRRAERVSRPTRPNSRRRSVFVVTIPAPRPIRAVQRARQKDPHSPPGTAEATSPDSAMATRINPDPEEWNTWRNSLCLASRSVRDPVRHAL